VVAAIRHLGLKYEVAAAPSMRKRRSRAPTLLARVDEVIGSRGTRRSAVRAHRRDPGDYVKKEDGTLVVDHESIQRSRLRVDTMKWMASKLAPRKYGDRVEHDVKSNVSMPAILIQVGGGAPEPIEVSGKVIEAE